MNEWWNVARGRSAFNDLKLAEADQHLHEPFLIRLAVYFGCLGYRRGTSCYVLVSNGVIQRDVIECGGGGLRGRDVRYWGKADLPFCRPDPKETGRTGVPDASMFCIAEARGFLPLVG